MGRNWLLQKEGSYDIIPLKTAEPTSPIVAVYGCLENTVSGFFVWKTYRTKSIISCLPTKCNKKLLSSAHRRPVAAATGCK